MIDIFNNDAFSMVSLTAAIEKMPHQPTRIGNLGYFRSEGITTTTVVVEERDGELSLIETSERGAPAGTTGEGKRRARSFLVPHLQRGSVIKADSIQGVRAFGAENNLEAVQTVVNQRLARLRAMHDVTLEYHRIGAIRGLILDADGTTVIYNLFTEFGISQQTYELNLAADVRQGCVDIMRLSEEELGAEAASGYRAFCGDNFFDALIAADPVTESLKFQESRLLRTDLRAGFEYGGITWENYRGKVGSVGFVPTNEAYVVPEGTGLFVTNFAPADYLETVNTVGLPLYAKVLPDPSGANRFVTLDTQSNPLCLCTRPRAVIKVTLTNAS